MKTFQEFIQEAENQGDKYYKVTATSQGLSLSRGSSLNADKLFKDIKKINNELEKQLSDGNKSDLQYIVVHTKKSRIIGFKKETFTFKVGYKTQTDITLLHDPKANLTGRKELFSISGIVYFKEYLSLKNKNVKEKFIDLIIDGLSNSSHGLEDNKIEKIVGYA